MYIPFKRRVAKIARIRIHWWWIAEARSFEFKFSSGEVVKSSAAQSYASLYSNHHEEEGTAHNRWSDMDNLDIENVNYVNITLKQGTRVDKRPGTVRAHWRVPSKKPIYIGIRQIQFYASGWFFLVRV